MKLQPFDKRNERNITENNWTKYSFHAFISIINNKCCNQLQIQPKEQTSMNNSWCDTNDNTKRKQWLKEETLISENPVILIQGLILTCYHGQPLQWLAHIFTRILIENDQQNVNKAKKALSFKRAYEASDLSRLFDIPC